MKNMEKLLLILFAISLIACESTPKFDTNLNDPVLCKEFIVTDITKYNNGMCVYTGGPKSTSHYVPFWQDPDICLPCGMYQINDTISIKRLNKTIDKLRYENDSLKREIEYIQN